MYTDRALSIDQAIDRLPVDPMISYAVHYSDGTYNELPTRTRVRDIAHISGYSITAISIISGYRSEVVARFPYATATATV